MLTISAGSKSHLEGPITKVLPKITVRWDGVNWTDETTYLKSLNITKSLEDKNFGPVANTFNAIVDNTTGRFSWPAESTRTPKKWVRLYAGINGTDVLVLTGVIDTIEQRRDGTALLKGRDVSAIAIDSPAPLKTYINQSPEDIIDDLWTTATGFSTSSDSTGITMGFMKFAKATSVWDAISSVCKKTAGRVNVLPDGTLKYESLIGKNYTPKATADWTCNTDDFDSITEQLSTKDIINAVIVSYKNKQVDENKAAYMLLSDPEGNSVQQDEDERLINWNIGEILAERHRAPEDGVIYLKRGHISSIASVMNDTTETDITAYCSVTDATSGKVTLSDGFTEGDEIRFRYKVSEMKLAINYGYTPAEGWTFEGEVANPTLDYEFGTGSATITLDDDPDPLLYPDADAVISISSISSGATLTKLWITGDVAVARIEKFKKFDNTSITVFGRQELQLELEGVSIDDARRVAQRTVDRYKDPSSTTDLSISVHPELDVMDVIEIADNIHTNINMGYEIESVTISLSNEDAKCSVRLRQYDSVAWTYTDNGITVVAPWDVKKPLVTPNITNAASTHNSISLSWERDWSAINYILVLKKGEDVIQTAYTSGNTYTFGSLDPETLYTVELTAVSKIGATAFTSANIETTKEPVVGDGVAPATPTWAATPLSTFFIGGKTYIQVDWEANTEKDLKGYEVAWSYDGSTWYNSGLTTETSLVIEVRAGVTVYAKVRAKDIEGFESSWTASQNITSAKDTTIPDNLSSISAVGGFDLIYISWVHTKPTDFSHYIVQRAADPYSSWSEVAIVQSKEFIDKSAAAGTYYKYRVKAVDIYGNEAAAWATTTTGVTCTSISSELSDLEGELSTLDGELSGLAGELSTLESELENLQFADIGGTITEVQIGDDTVSAPKLKSNSVESAKIKAGAVTTEKIYALAVTTEKLKSRAVTAEKIAAGAVTTEKLYAAAVTAEKIAADAIEANHIKAGSVTANKLEALLKIASGKAIQAGPDDDNYTMLPTGFERTKQFASKVYSVEARVKVYFAYSGEELTPSLSFSTDGGSSWSSWYGGVTLHEDGTTTGQWQWFTLNSAMVPKFATDVVGASLTNFKVKVRLATNSGYVRVSTIDVIVNGGSAGILDTQSEWNDAKDASSDNVSTFDDSGEGYIRGTDTALSYTYIQTSASGFAITQAAQNLSKIVPTILNAGEVAFDGIETSKIVTFGLELEPSGYEVMLIPLQCELSKTSWTPDTHIYKLHLECRKSQESPYGWFWLDFFMEEYSSDPNVYHSDSPWLTSSYQDLFTGGATMTQVDLDLYDWGALNIFKQKVWHKYASAGSRTVQAKVFGGVTTISWGDETTTDIETFGGVRLKNITEIRSSVAKKPIAGKVNWILFQT